jgi:multiple sugar transport system substrate-binding protein
VTLRNHGTLRTSVVGALSLGLCAAGLVAWSPAALAANRHPSVSVARTCAGQGATGSLHGSTTVSFAYSSDQEFTTGKYATEWFGMLKRKFQSEHPGVTVKLIPIGGSQSSFIQKISLMLRSSSTAPDLIHEWTTQVGAQMEAKQIAPLNQYLAQWPDWKNFPTAVRLGGVPGPGVYQMVSGVNDFGIYYDVNQFKQAGLTVPWQPKSWATVLSAARAIQKSVTGTIPLWMYAGNDLYTQVTRENFLPLLQGTGSKVTKGLKWVAKSPGINAVLAFYHTVFASGLGPSASLLSNPTATATVDGTLMPKQKVAIALVGNWDAGWWLPGGPDPSPTALSAYRVAKLPTEHGQAPGFATQATGSTFVMSCASKHRKLAAELLELAESPHFNLLHMLWTSEGPPQTDLSTNHTYVSHVPYFNNAESSWLKYASFSPSYNYLAYATCVGEVTGDVEANGTSASAGAQELESCLTHAVGSSGITTDG